MSSRRPIVNLEKVLASINLQDDAEIMTPEPVMAQGPVFPVARPTSVQALMEDCFTTGSLTGSARTSEDVPLTEELLTPTVQNSLDLGNSFDSVTTIRNDTPDPVRTQKRLKPENSRKVPVKKNGLPFKLPASSDSVLEYDSNSDCLEMYQDRKKGQRQATRHKKKLVKKQSSSEKRGKHSQKKKE